MGARPVNVWARGVAGSGSGQCIPSGGNVLDMLTCSGSQGARVLGVQGVKGE